MCCVGFGLFKVEGCLWVFCVSGCGCWFCMCFLVLGGGLIGCLWCMFVVFVWVLKVYWGSVGLCG